MVVKHVLPTDNAAAFATRFCANPQTPNEPLRLHQGQIDFISHPAAEKIGVCGRRWGKTLAEAVETILFALRHPGTEQYIIAPTQDQASIIFGMIEGMINSGPLEVYVDSWRYSPFPVLTLRDGTTVHARSAGRDGRYIRGHHADRVVFDECAFIARVVVQEVVPPMMAASKYARIARISTPFGRNHFWESYQHGIACNNEVAKSWQFPSWTNPFLSLDYLKQERIQRTKMAWDVEYGAQFHDSHNVLFNPESILRCIDDEMADPEPAIPGHQYVIGFDPAKWNDRSGLVVLDKTELPYRLVAIRDLSGRDYTLQEMLVADEAKRYNNAVVLQDSTSHDRTLEALVGQGLEAHGFHFTAERKWELMMDLARLIENEDIRYPRNLDFIRELQQYELIVKTTGGVKLGAPEQGYDDLATAAALAYCLAKAEPAEITIDFVNR